MSGDFSRLGTRRWPIYDGTLLQQGRPLTDRDWNDLVAQLNRRDQMAVLDAFGPLARSVAPPEAFKIAFDSAAGDLTVAPGRIYVDGLLAENFGIGDVVWDAVLGEEYGKNAVAYQHQKWLPDPPALPKTGGPYLVYLDVWRREVTHNQDSDIAEKALGVDSTTRLQTVWQLKVLDSTTGVDCETGLDTISAFKPSRGRLTSGTEEVPGDDNPCLVPPSGGYKGLENQLYRVEIHSGGKLGAATFKWSRDNASVETRVVSLSADATQLVVESIGRDDVLGFKAGDWVEIIDDWKELKGLPGELRRIKVDGIDKALRTITLESPVKPVPTPAGQTDPFPTGGDGKLQADRNTRLRRWDQKGKILDKDGDVYADLDLPGSDGDILVPADGTALLLESGVVVTFSIATGLSDGEFHAGDYWAIWARATDATIDLLDEEPPRGIHHHYAKLALFTPPGTVVECKPKPEEHADCCFTVVVTPGDDATDDIQKAIDSLKLGGCICLKPGIHKIKSGLMIPRSNVSLKGESAGVTIQLKGEGVVLHVGDPKGEDRISGIDISTIAFERIETKGEPPAIVTFTAVDGSVIQDCTLSTPMPTPSLGIHIEDGGNLRVQRCSIERVQAGILATSKEGTHDLLFEANRIDLTNKKSDSGGWAGIVVTPVDEKSPSLIARIVIRDNIVGDGAFGVAVVNAFDTDIIANTITGAKVPGIGVYLQAAWYGQVSDNSIGLGQGAACVCIGGVENSITANTMIGGGVGIFLLQEALPSSTLNRIGSMSVAGIAAVSVLAGATDRCDIVENRISNCGFGAPPNCAIGVLGMAGDLHIEGNEIINTGIALDGKTQPPGTTPVFGIAAFLAQETTVQGNLVTYTGPSRPEAAEDRALLMLGLMQVSQNDRLFGFPALITANKFTGWGRSALVEIFALAASDAVKIQFERVFFSNNYCMHMATKPVDGGATVRLDGNAASAMGNQVKGLPGKFVSIDFKKMTVTCVGNITSGPIIGANLTPGGVGLNLVNVP